MLALNSRLCIVVYTQGSGGDQSNILCKDLERLGYKVWYDNGQNALHRNLEGMKSGVRQSVCLMIFLSGRKETKGVADVSGLYEGPFTRWFCHEEMTTAHEQELRCIGVMETDERKGRPDMGVEKSRALTGRGGRPVNPNAIHNVHLLDDVCFIPFRRQQHEVDGMLTEIQKQAAEAPALRPYQWEPELESEPQLNSEPEPEPEPVQQQQQLSEPAVSVFIAPPAPKRCGSTQAFRPQASALSLRCQLSWMFES